MPIFQFVSHNFPKQFLEIFRIFFSVRGTRFFKFFIFLLIPCTLCLIPFLAYAAQVTLAWDPSVGSVTGYKMHYGTTRDDYGYSVDVGNSTSCTISGLQEGATYYFAVTAYNDIAESDYSNEITYAIPFDNSNENFSSTTVEVRVAASSDDAEESASGSMNLASYDLELIDDRGNQTVGIRFVGVGIPQGATIVDAYVQFKTDETTSQATALTIEAQDTDNAQPFTYSTWNISNRTTTGVDVWWDPAAWTTVGEAGAAQRTPDLSSIIQEVVNRPGWSSGNSLVLIITGTGKRVAESYRGDPNGAPLLHVEYSTGPAANQAPNDDGELTDSDTVIIGDNEPGPGGEIITEEVQVADNSDDGELTDSDTVIIGVNEPDPEAR